VEGKLEVASTLFKLGQVVLLAKAPEETSRELGNGERTNDTDWAFGLEESGNIADWADKFDD